MNLRWGARTHVAADGVSIHVETAGRVDAPVVVGLHGFTSGTFTWAGLAPLLVDEHRFVAWDRPPFGRSDRPRPRTGAGDPYSVEAELARTLALHDDVVGHRRPHVVVGHSAGALLAVQATLAGVIAPRALVLVAPALGGAPPPLIRSLARVPGSGAVATAALRVALRGAGAALRAGGRHPNPVTEAASRATARAMREPGTAEALWHLTKTWEPADVLDGADTSVLPAITVITGADDRIARPENQAATAERLGAEHVVLDGVGHVPHEQVPDEVARIIRALAG